MAATATRLNLTKTKVLAVDDSPQAMDILSQILMGFNVAQTTKCVSAVEAVQAAAQEPYHIVIVDEEMPERDGYDVISTIRGDAQGPNFTAPIVLASANPSMTTIQRARDAGANVVITKPIVPGVLLRHMQWIARNNRSFVDCATYRGPDRRFHNRPLPEGISERREETLRLMETQDRALSQNEVDSLFD